MDRIYIRASKGDKDRCVPLPKCLHEPLVEHLREVRKVHDGDRAANVQGVYMPGALDKKMPKAGRRWEWFWVFPMASLSKDPRGAADAPKRRHHVLPGAYQQELSIAAAKAEIPKRSNSHILWHSYATHLSQTMQTRFRNKDLKIISHCILDGFIMLRILNPFIQMVFPKRSGDNRTSLPLRAVVTYVYTLPCPSVAEHDSHPIASVGFAGERNEYPNLAGLSGACLC